MALTTTSGQVVNAVPVFHGPGKYAYAVRCVSPTDWRGERKNTGRYRTVAKQSGTLATKALALAWCESDWAVVRPTGVASTTTTAQYTQPAVGATVVIAFASATGYAVDMTVDVDTGGRYQIVSIASLNVTCRNLGGAANAAPAAIVPTARTVTAVGGTGAA